MNAMILFLLSATATASWAVDVSPPPAPARIELDREVVLRLRVIGNSSSSLNSRGAAALWLIENYTEEIDRALGDAEYLRSLGINPDAREDEATVGDIFQGIREQARRAAEERRPLSEARIATLLRQLGDTSAASRREAERGLIDHYRELEVRFADDGFLERMGVDPLDDRVGDIRFRGPVLHLNGRLTERTRSSHPQLARDFYFNTADFLGNLANNGFNDLEQEEFDAILEAAVRRLEAWAARGLAAEPAMEGVALYLIRSDIQYGINSERLGERLPILARLLDSSDAGVRTGAAVTLLSLGEPARPYARRLREWFNSDDPLSASAAELRQARQGLASLAPDVPTAASLARLLGHRSYEVRYNALEALAQLGSAAAAERDRVERVLRGDPEEKVRRYAARVLVTIAPDKDTVRLFGELLPRSDKYLAVELLQGLGRLGPAAASEAEAIEACLHSPGLGYAAIKALASVRPDAETIGILRGLLNHKVLGGYASDALQDLGALPPSPRKP